MNRIIRGLDPLFGEPQSLRKAYHDWYLQARVPQVRYIAFLTAFLYLVYAATEQRVAQDTSDLRLILHAGLVPFLLLTIGLMSFYPRLYRAMWLLLVVTPVGAISGSLLLNLPHQTAAYYTPEIYLCLMWIFAISGLALGRAVLSASAMVLIVLVATFQAPLDSGFMALHLLWITSAYLFGVVSAFVLEKAHKSIFLQQRRLTHLATVDGLTDLWNRTHIEKLLAEECERAARYGKPFSIILCDIDHFKEVNDTFGHAVGDHVLQAFSTLLRQNVRQVDRVGRLGGEEFLILLPETTSRNALLVARSLRDRINDTDFEVVEKLTASFGIAEYQLGEDRRSLLERADRALYRAKDKGRDCIETWTDTEALQAVS